jgi:tRNA/tmRNA/rRNA uracil-C5-methylase (TrmA/RlmC/RlmD family)
MAVNPLQIPEGKATPACPLFGACGGCQYQNILYEEELVLKKNYLSQTLAKILPGADFNIEPVIPSPRQYHYRSRLDIKFLKTRRKEYFLGFTPVEGRGVIEVPSCAIALQALCDFIPQLKAAAIRKLPDKYRQANLVVKTGDDQRVFFGGIGHRSLRLSEADYLWTEVEGQKIFYSLDSFFQANLSILPIVIKTMRGLGLFDKSTIFYDLYGGVGLFSVCLSKQVKEAIIIEENIYATRLADYNIRHNAIDNIRVMSGKLEDFIDALSVTTGGTRQTALIDPPRGGLSLKVSQYLSNRPFHHLLYLSCNPETLARDLGILTSGRWKIQRIIPMDFFPRTRHLEVLTVLIPK